jgi:hypothetical protein
VCASAGLRGCSAVGTRSATVTPTCAMRRTASISCGPQSHCSLPRTSPVKHSLWIRTSSATSGSADTAASQAEGEMLPAVGEPVEGVDPRVVPNPSANRSGSMTWVRIVAAGRCIVLSFSPGRNGPRARSAGVRRCRTGAPPPAPHGGLGSTGSFHRRRTVAPGSRPRRKAPRPGAARPQGRS